VAIARSASITSLIHRANSLGSISLASAYVFAAAALGPVCFRTRAADSGHRQRFDAVADPDLLLPFTA
jgi:hypothetical protein